eukprot:TRINITY_DN13586_c0_g1_i1.p1 TRINITY_DN13586_c0_g1~~TRINITY_DN13586_c0_g1_i1.p1  ORF type:complete len:443 (-),score=83.64 TRINITY_DN13586_c0_g1_i1:68-1396(-)
MGEINFFERGCTFIKEATDLDAAKQYTEALEKYQKGLDFLVTHLKYEKNARSRDAIQKKVEGYFVRAEELKQFVQGDKKGSSGGGAAGGGPKASHSDADQVKAGDEDPDRARLRGALDGAIVKEKPNVRWDDVAGLEGAKAALREAVILPVKFPHLFTGKRQPWKGILLYGPPGTGKSHLAKAVATEVDSTFFSVSSSDLVSKWLGESERLVRNLFEMARDAKPAIIFIDEVDSLCGSRSDQESESARRIKTEFLVQMQGVGSAAEQAKVLVLAATNLPWALDSAIRRRFERRIYIPLPDPIARERMLQIHLGDTAHSLQAADFKQLAQSTDGFSGSDISVMVRDALMEPVRRLQSATHFRRVRGPDPTDPKRIVDDLWEACSPGADGATVNTLMDIEGSKVITPRVSMSDFKKSLKTCRPSVNKDDLERYEKWTQEFGQDS